MTGIRVYDKLEEELPNLGIVPMTDSETQQTRWIDTSSVKVRKQYAAFQSQRKKPFNNSLNSMEQGP